MDEQTKTQFKWKFYRLTVELNLIVLLVAASILIFFIVHSSYTVPLIGGMLVMALLIGMDFFRKYHETKTWLDINTVKEHESERGPPQ
jgi:hypothetical protein